MQFYENYVKQCNKISKSPSSVANEIGIQKSTVSRWSKGAVPRYATLLRIADYFGVSIGELAGATPETEKQIAEELGISVYNLREQHSAEEPEAEPAAKPDTGLSAALEALRNQPGRRMLLAATSGMTEEQVERMASWIAEIRGGGK